MPHSLAHILDGEQRERDNAALKDAATILAESLTQLTGRIEDQQRVLTIKVQREDLDQVNAVLTDMAGLVIKIQREVTALAERVETNNDEHFKMLLRIALRLDEKPEPKVYDVKLDDNGIVSRIIAH